VWRRGRPKPEGRAPSKPPGGKKGGRPWSLTKRKESRVCPPSNRQPTEGGPRGRIFVRAWRSVGGHVPVQDRYRLHKLGVPLGPRISAR